MSRSPLVTVVITTYNYAQYLPTALASVYKQQYPNIEVIVIDDGSTDNTAGLLKNYPGLKYFYQENKGLSAARNLGIVKSTGEYLVFLDADDWLEDDAIRLNAEVLNSRPGISFVSGNYLLLRAGDDRAHNIEVQVNDSHYLELLKRNYIGMHAAVMYRRAVLEEFNFDETLRSCEDYDLYLRIARKYPVFHQQAFIATYNFHEKGLSHNYQLMIDSIKRVMEKQKAFLENKNELSAYGEGSHQWKQYYCLDRYLKYRSGKALSILKNPSDLAIFISANPRLLFSLLKADLQKFFLRKKNNLAIPNSATPIK